MSEAFEDARSEIDSQFTSNMVADSMDNVDHISVAQDIIEPHNHILDDDLELPPLETFFGEFDGLALHPDCASLAADLENDLLPSTPLTEDQLR